MSTFWKTMLGVALGAGAALGAYVLYQRSSANVLPAPGSAAVRPPVTVIAPQLPPTTYGGTVGAAPGGAIPPPPTGLPAWASLTGYGAQLLASLPVIQQIGQGDGDTPALTDQGL